MKVKVGIIGVGNIGTAHASSVYNGEVEGMELCALCDSDAQRADALKSEFPGVPVFLSSDELICSGTVDAVIIATPHYFHPTIAIDALKAGLHVLSEKPIGVYTYAVRELIEEHKKSDKIIAVMLNQRANKLFSEAKLIIDNGGIGEITRSVWIITNWYRTKAYYDSSAWRATWAGEGGGVLMNQAPHNLDLWQWLCGMPKSIYAICNEGKHHDIEVEDEATIFAEYENGASGVFIASTGDYPGTNRLEITGTRGRLILEKNTLTYQKFSCDARDFSAGRCEKIDIEEQIIFDEDYNGHRALLQNFANAILYGEPLVATASEALCSLLICNAAYLSAWKGEKISLSIDEKEYFELLKKRAELSSQKKSHSPNHLDGTYKKRWDTNW